ncbi:MAG TPA: hypothetical protein VG603_15450 [Chitinophagales bacterium]|nr:hypothetical protein [Chitinophagales bacterium]
MKSAKHVFTFSFFIIVMAALLFSSCKQRAAKQETGESIKITGNQVYTDTGSSSVKVFDQNGRVCVQQSNTYYEMVNVLQQGKAIPVLLKIRKTELCFADSINKTKVYEVTAKSVLDTKPIAWDAKFVGTDMQFKDNTIIDVTEGADNEEDFFRRYSLLNGNEVFNCSYGELKVSIPNVKDKRFIGYTSQKAASAPIQAMNQENLLGVINYGSADSPGTPIWVKLKRSGIADKIPNNTPDMVLVPANDNTTAIEDGKSIILMRADEHYQPKDVTDFSLKMTFYFGADNEATYITIPVVNDHLDLANAKYDKDIFELTSPAQ